MVNHRSRPSTRVADMLWPDGGLLVSWNGPTEAVEKGGSRGEERHLAR
jgi:hypothetical protein